MVEEGYVVLCSTAEATWAGCFVYATSAAAKAAAAWLGEQGFETAVVLDMEAPVGGLDAGDPEPAEDP